MVLIGVDEVGRGALAGDLLVCAFAFRPDAAPDVLAAARAAARDSKSFSSRRRRESAFVAVVPAGLFRLSWSPIAEIEALNIRGATHAAMRRAALGLAEDWSATYPDLEVPRIAIDGNDLPHSLPSDAFTMVGGDAGILEIAAASIVAKVTRDQRMDALAEDWPGYALERNSGYGSAGHRAGLEKLGMSPIHRSWARKFTATSS